MNIHIYKYLLFLILGFAGLTVSAAPPTLDVNVVNTPLDVNLDGSVQIDSSTPLDTNITNSQIHTVDAGEPFQIGDILTIQTGTTGFAEILTTVPAGKRAVIEFVSARVFVDTDRPFICDVYSNNVQHGHFLRVDTVPRSNDFVKIVSQPVVVYVDQEEPISFSCTFAQPPLTVDVLVSVSISGKYYDVP